MTKPIGRAVLFGLACAMPLGCSAREEAFHPVSGRVVIAGKPLTNGVVVFHADAGRGNTTKHEPRGEINDKGEFVIMTIAKSGAPAGWYKVTVASQVGTVNPNAPYSVPKWAVHQKYLNASTTPLSVEVKKDMPAGSVTLSVEK